MDQQQLEVIETLKEYLPNLINGILSVIDKINENKLNDTLNMMANIIEGVEWVYEVYSLTQQDEISKNEIENLECLLMSILKSYENEDSILAKDLLKYDLLPIISSIQILY